MRFSAGVRDLVRSDPLLYYVWLRCKGVKKELPKGRDSILVDGFQRSGNTFLSGVLEEIIDRKIYSHFHAIAALRRAKRENLTTLVLIREPAASIRSSIAKRVQEFKINEKRAVLWDLDGYYRYYRHCESNLDNIILIKFEAMVTNPEPVVNKVIQAIEVAGVSENMIAAAVQVVKDRLRNDVRPGAIRNFPSEEKEEIKRLYDYVLDLPEYKKCWKVYSSLIQGKVID